MRLLTPRDEATRVANDSYYLADITSDALLELELTEQSSSFGRACFLPTPFRANFTRLGIICHVGGKKHLVLRVCSRQQDTTKFRVRVLVSSFSFSVLVSVLPCGVDSGVLLAQLR